MKWKCGDGSEVEIGEMSTAHLENAIAMLKRKGFVSLDVFFSCGAYAFSADTPDGAAACAEAEFDRMTPSKLLGCLEGELNKRKGALN